MIASGVVLLLFVLLAAGMPVAFALAVAGSLGLYLVGGVQTLTGVLATTPLSTAATYELISVPMFILMAEFVILSGVADNLFKAAAAWVGRVPGGLAMATAIPAPASARSRARARPRPRHCPRPLCRQCSSRVTTPSSLRGSWRSPEPSRC
jgi:TRAP-type mannitol/chloroaromatic compound transport system permease large subunit